MLTKNEAKILKSLKQSKFRQKYQKFLVENPKTANEFLRGSTYEVDRCLVTEAYVERYADLLASYTGEYEVITPRQMEQVSALTSASDILLVVNMPAPTTVPNSGRLIYLDRVQDPGNVGTIIRIADWYGIDAVVASPGCADYYNPKTVQSTMGSMVNVRLCSSTFAAMPTLPLYGAVMDGAPLPAVASDQWILVIGNESKGIQHAIINQLDHKVTIMGSPDRIAESLNAAMASAILIDRMVKW